MKTLSIVLLLLSLPLAGCGDTDRGDREGMPNGPESDGPESDGPESDGPESDGPVADGPAAAEPALEPSAELDVDAFAELGGEVVIDGSSTVFPITEATAAVYERLAPSSRVRLGVSGTGGGFAKFCRGETDISNASRPIKAEESERCRRAGVEFIEVPVAFDGVSVVVHGENDWAPCMTLGELRELWRPRPGEPRSAEARPGEPAPTRWDEIRAGWPARPITLHAPGRDSGTFDYFTEAVVGEEGRARADFIGSEDDYLIAQDVAADRDALGFFGFAYYGEHRRRLGLVAVDAGAGCVEPSERTIADGTYRPLSRPIFLYLSVAALERPEVARFVELYLDLAPRAVPAVGYVPLPERAYALDRRRIAQRRTGSLFSGGSQVGVSIERLLELEADAQRGDPEP